MRTTSTVWRLYIQVAARYGLQLVAKSFQDVARIRRWEIPTSGKARPRNTLAFRYSGAINEKGGLEVVAFGWTQDELKNLVTVSKQFGIESPRVSFSVFNDEFRFDDVADVP